ncbi:transposon Tf2-1 polyprotein isoform X1 [Cucumis melo var. makuwa]|uniref:Transposon Tf2-1 polyprotein isoform X1 n=1 Tax=Cucumis melo var. makuwa TaxID=1194695 RepID=A0A5D3BX41_CUCMM|nr:transposon Tf2-1 polyprotein isoform X1 [Cucumis melo var. makuwa]TYK03665.1 transposon Tf2-1 polyprotein isoform X1 [Cucumis melo var. makuwa]
MAKKSEERLDFVEQEVREMRTELKKLPAMEENMSLISKMGEGKRIYNRSVGWGIEGERKSEDDKAFDRSKFKKVEMPIFNGTDHDSWLFRADR